MASASPNTAVLCLAAANNSSTCTIGFTSSGLAYAANGTISYSNNTNTMTLSTLAGAQITLNGTTILMGTTTAQPSYKAYVNGAFYASSASATVKSFDIPNEGKGPGWRLRHRVLESPQAGVVYHFKMDCEVGDNTLELPGYYSWLAVDPIVHVTPYKCFGVGWGDVDAEGKTLTVTVNQAGSYRVTLSATRNDPGSVQEFDEFGVEYRQAI
jgi:hypothetical protein